MSPLKSFNPSVSVPITVLTIPQVLAIYILSFFSSPFTYRFNVEVFQETDNYKVSIYNIKKKKLEEVKKIHKNDIELKATVLNFMNQKN